MGIFSFLPPGGGDVKMMGTNIERSSSLVIFLFQLLRDESSWYYINTNGALYAGFIVCASCFDLSAVSDQYCTSSWFDKSNIFQIVNYFVLITIATVIHFICRY